MTGRLEVYVYILRSKKDTGYYIGSTSRLLQRIKEHNSGKTVSLRNRLPLELVYKESYKTRSKAVLREKQLKSYKSGRAFKKLLENN